ncbi:MAG: hypothetical protein ACHQIG_09055 [Acidimicrobiia bacterium]
MELLTYVRALRRRWILILACVVLGGAVGFASTQLDHGTTTTKKGRTYYKATNTVVLDYSSNQGGIQPVFTNLDQIALLATTGEVPQRVADKLGTPGLGPQLGEQVYTTTDATTSTLDVTAVDADPDRAAKLADTFSSELDASLQERDQQRFETAINDLNLKIAALQQTANDLLAKLQAVPAPPDIDTLRRQYDATQNNYYSRFSQLQQTSAAGPASTSLTVLQSATPEAITAAEYAQVLALGASGQNHLRIAPGDVATTQLAPAPTSSSFNSPVARSVMGAFLGFLIGAGIALFAERLDRRVRSREEVEQAFQLPVLAEVPRLSRKDQADDQLVAFSAPMSRVAEAFRAIRTSLVFQQSMSASAPPSANGGVNGNGAGAAPPARGIAEPLVVMVTSAAPREGKSTTSANLAVSFAEANSTVLVVNCDFRRPTIHLRFGVVDEPRRVQDTRVPGVKIVTNVLTDPSANPSQVVAAQRQVIAAARGRFDVIILDTAPMLTANDAVEVVGSVDLVVLVARLGLTTGDSARRVVDTLARVNAVVGGVVLIGSADMSNEYYYYYQRAQTAKAKTEPPSTVTAPGGQPTARADSHVGDMVGGPEAPPPDDAVTH